ncbi:hypothetical protein ElyMa_002583700 [Elysia marginata]|uniref:Uncharacterized protein n=1 Tax=Elysia marginata TaxID=1093978 RepID=A0AAV4GYU1_9GAST|nr:hypothetical protein ElyMa_002583700 [Elysia marginata]
MKKVLGVDVATLGWHGAGSCSESTLTLVQTSSDYPLTQTLKLSSLYYTLKQKQQQKQEQQKQEQQKQKQKQEQQKQKEKEKQKTNLKK